MTTAYTSLLGLALPVQGELSGVWGDTVNNSITSLLDSAVAGTTTVSTDADVTLTTTTGAANTAREAILLFSGARTALRNVTAPAQSKIYTVINATTGGYSVVLRGAGPTTGVTILAGESAVCAWNGSDFVKVSNSGASTFYTITATAPTTASANKGAINYGTLSFSDTGIVQSAQTSVNSYFQNVIQNTSAGTGASAEFIAYNDQGTASTNYATVGINSSGYSGTGSINAAGYGYFLSASTDLVLGTIGANGIHFTTNSSASDALAISSTGVISIPSSGTANGVAYLNTSKQLTTGGALTFDGANLGVGATNPVAKLDVISNTTYQLHLATTTGNYSSAGIYLGALGTSDPNYYGYVTYDQTSETTRIGNRTSSAIGGIAFYTGGAFTPVERARIDFSGNLLVGTTTAGPDRFRVSSPGNTTNQIGLVSSDDASGNGFIQFRNSAGTSIGSIARVTTTNAVAYNTTSDYRLKTVVGAVSGAGDRIDALKPIDYLWTEGGQQDRGFLAHEFQEVYANSVTGIKDAVDAEGNPVYQAMQPSAPEVIADLVAEIQSLRKRLAAAGI